MTAAGNIIERMAWTFAQAFFGSLASAGIIADLEGAKLAGAAALSAGIAALISAAKTLSVEGAARVNQPH